MIRLLQRKLIIPRGDTGTFSIPALAIPSAGDIAIFSILDKLTQTKIFEKKIELTPAMNTILIEFTHGDTVNLKPGSYLWDIKIYHEPQYANDELIDAAEIHSYYAGFSLPECEIRPTADQLLMADDAPTSTLSPESLNVINAAINEALKNKNITLEASENAENKAAEAFESAENAAEFSERASQSAELAEARVNEIENLSVEISTGAEGSNANVSYTPATGVLSFEIPRGDTGKGIASCILNADFTLTINYTDGTSMTTVPIRGDTPHLTIGEVTEGPNAIATITGTDANPILNLTLPNANVPTRVSQLENDSNYAVDANYVHTDNNYTTAEKEKLSGIAAGAEVNVNADWNATSGDAQILNKPTNVSAFTNDAGYLTFFTETDPTVPAWAKAAEKPSYTAAEVGAPTIAEMEQAIANVNTMKIHICAQGEYDSETGIPTIQNPDTQTFYLVPGGEGNNLFIEWAYVNSAWERFGSADVDLSNYVQKTDYATTNNAGVVKILAGSGLVMALQDGSVAISTSSNSQIKAGTQAFRPITPSNQHASTFYGLAKAAGDTTQSQSDNAVGTYTDEAKAAIRSMIGAAASADLTVQDVQVNGTSVVENGVANVPIASAANVGVVKPSYGVAVDVNGNLTTSKAPLNYIKQGGNGYSPIVPDNQHNAVFYGLAKAAGDTTQSASSNAVGVYTDNAKASIKAMLGIVDGSTGTVDVSGTTPTIAAVENTRYVCGEVTSLNFTPAASGICIVRFTSGSTVTVLTLPSTVKFPEWFDPTSLETNTIYEICVTDGVYGAVMSWAL